MEYIETPHAYDQHDDKIAVFLAGGIGNCPDWQSEATDMLNGTELLVLNPRRADFGPPPWTKEKSRVQIEWEFHALRRADIILFWFPGCESIQPIALFELGYWLGQNERQLVIGRSKDYLRKDDIDIQVSLARPRQSIFSRLGSCIDMVEYLAEKHPRAWKPWHA